MIGIRTCCPDDRQKNINDDIKKLNLSAVGNNSHKVNPGWFVALILIAVLVLVASKNVQTRAEYKKSALITPIAGQIDRERYRDYTEQNFSYAKAQGRTVLFFAATTWCSNCTLIDKQIKERIFELPIDITILKVDYDNDRKMKTKYGIIHQTTLILFNESGNELKRWIGTDFDDLLQMIS